MSRSRAKAAKSFNVEATGQATNDDPTSIPVGDSDLPAGLSQLFEPGIFKKVRSELMSRGLARPNPAKSLSSYWARLAQETEEYATLKLPDGLALRSIRFEHEALDALSMQCAKIVISMLETGFGKKSQPSGQTIADVLIDILDSSKAIKAILLYIHIELREISSKHDTLKKKYRRRAELPDPTKSADAEVNRPTVQVKLRIDPRIAAAIDEVVTRSAETRSDWWVDAAMERMKREHPELFQKIKSLIGPEPK